MAVSPLQKIADDIKLLESAGRLDLAELNRHLRPLAEIRLICRPSGILRTERKRQSSTAGSPTHSPRLEPAQPECGRSFRNKTAESVGKGNEAISIESCWKCGSAIAQGRPAHDPTSESSDEDIGHNDTSTAPESHRENMQRGTPDNVVLQERRSARIASQDKIMGGGQYPAAFRVGRGRKDKGRGKQSTNNTRDGHTEEQHGSRNGHIGFTVGGKASKDQTLSGGESRGEKKANEPWDSPNPYSKSLMVELPTCASDESERGAKRGSSDDELQIAPAKRHQALSTGLEPGLPQKFLSSQAYADLLPKAQQDTEDVDGLKSQFRSRWTEKLPTFDGWQKLDRFARIGACPDQVPYVELESIMQRVLSIGTLNVQATFARSVTAWVASPHITKCAVEPPVHLQSIPGFEAAPFQRFWKAMEVSRCAKGVEDMAILLRRKSLVDLILAYNEVIKHVRLCAAGGKLKLRSGETAGAKAREIVYSILYPEAETRKKMRTSFNYDQQCASAYVKLEKRFGNIGILAMIPTKLNEMDFRSTDVRFAAFMEMLDIIRPELRGPRVRFYAGIIETIAAGGVPDASRLQDLAVWTSTKSSLRSPSSTEQASSAPADTVAEAIQ